MNGTLVDGAFVDGSLVGNALKDALKAALEDALEDAPFVSDALVGDVDALEEGFAFLGGLG